MTKEAIPTINLSQGDQPPLEVLFEQGPNNKPSPVGNPRKEIGIWYQGIFQPFFVPFEELERIGLTAPLRRGMGDRDILHIVFINRIAERNGSVNPI